MNLVDQIFEQAKLGTAVDPSANPFATGVQLGQHQQQIDAQKRQLALEVAQAPLKQTLLAQDAAMNEAKLQMFLQGREDTAKATQAFAGLASAVSPLLEAGEIDKAQNALMEAGANNAFLLNDPRFKSLYDFTTKAQDAKLALLRARSESFTPKLVTLTDEATGKPITVVQTGPHVSQIADLNKSAMEKKALELRQQRLEKELAPSAKAELRDIYDQIKSKREKLDALPEMSGMVWNRVANPKRAALQTEIDALREKAKQLEAPPPAAAAPSASKSFEVGKTYTDAQGNKAIYRGDGLWTPLP